jgi:hypothetical protein
MELIAKGDATGVVAAARKHLESSQLYAVADADKPVRAAAVRGSKDGRK